MILLFFSLHTATVPFLSPVNFVAEDGITVLEGDFVNFTSQIITNSSLTRTPTWSRININLPEDSHTVQYSKDGNIYASLTIDKASPDDKGFYHLSATNQCGSSIIFVGLGVVECKECSSY